MEKLLPAIKIRKEEGEKKIKELKKEGVLELKAKIKKVDDFLILPLKEGEKGEFFEVFELKNRPKSPKEYGGIKEMGITLVGDLCIIESKEDKKKLTKIAEMILKEHKNIKAVFLKKSGRKGKERLISLEHLAGEKRTETIHKENGFLFKLDMEKVFFSPRYGYERKRISEKYRNKKIAVFFAGVGPFAIQLAKNNKVVYAVEINKDAFFYLLKNIKLNRATNVVPILGDVKEKYKEIKEKVDVVVMPLPKEAKNFLEEAKKVLKKGGTIILYSLEKKDNLEKTKSYLEEKTKAKKIEIREVRPYSKEESIFCFEIEGVE